MHLLKHRSIRFYLVFFVILAIAIGGSVAAFADSPVAQVAVGTGGLSETGPANVSANAVTLNGANQTTPYTLGIAVNDDTGTGTGWNLTITSTQFTVTGSSCGTNHPLSTTASTITGVAVANNGGGTYTQPTNNISNTSLSVPAGCPALTPVKFFNATANSGMGHFTITPTISIAIPANAYAGTYTSTVTLAVVSGP